MSDEVGQGTRNHGDGSGSGADRRGDQTGAAAVDQDNDPLAELIRIVKQEDPFADILGEVQQRQQAAASDRPQQQPEAAPEAQAPAPEEPRQETAAPASHAPRSEEPARETAPKFQFELRPANDPSAPERDQDEPAAAQPTDWDSPRSTATEPGSADRHWFDAPEAAEEEPRSETPRAPEADPAAAPRPSRISRPHAAEPVIERRPEPEPEAPAPPPVQRSAPEPVHEPAERTAQRYEPPAEPEQPAGQRPPLDPINLERALRELRDSPEMRQAAPAREPAYQEPRVHDEPHLYGEPETHHEPTFGDEPDRGHAFDDHARYDHAQHYGDEDTQSPEGEEFQLGPAEARPGAYYDDPDTGLSAAIAGAAADEHQHGSEHDTAAGAQPRRRRGTYFAVGMLLGFAVLGGVFAFAYKGVVGSGSSGSEPPVISADSTPAKLPPEEQTASASTGNESTVYDRFTGGSSNRDEKIVPREEKIITLPRKSDERIPGQDAAESDTQGPPTTTVPGSTTLAARNPGDPQDSQQTSGLAPTPKRVKTVVVRPDGTLVRPSNSTSGASGSETPSATPPVQQASQQDADQPQAQPSVPVPALRPRPPQTQQAARTPAAAEARVPSFSPPSQNRVQTQQVARSEPAATSAPAPAQSAAPAASSGSGGFVVQLAARRSEAQALAAYDKLKEQYSSLGRYRPLIQRADLGDRGVYYRVRVGPMSNQNQAADLCNNLKAAGLSDCLVRPR